jgi:hypothetical protein
MTKKWLGWLQSASIAGGLGLGAAAMAQTTTFQPFKGLFSPKTASQQKAVDVNRLTEIQVELAWMSDPMTFPYFLEARFRGMNLELRGYVPSKAVHEQAVALAKLNCPMPLIDGLKVHSSLAVRPVHREPDQLKSSVQTALREAFPSQHLNVQCQIDGNVQITGAVRSVEQKLAVSLALRRLHGCASVTNLTEIAGGDVARPAPVAAMSTARTTSMAPSDPVVPLAKVTPDQKRNGPFTLFTKPPPPLHEPAPTESTANKIKMPDAPGSATSTSGTLQSTSAQGNTGGSYESRGVVFVANEEPTNTKAIPAPQAPPPAPITPMPKAASVAHSLSGTQLKKRIESAIPGLRNVAVTFTSKTDVHIDCAMRPGDDSGTIAGQILSLRELEPYKVDLQLQIPTDRK